MATAAAAAAERKELEKVKASKGPPAHQWDISGQRPRMAIEEESAAGSAAMFGAPPVVDPAEAERYVEALRKFNIEEVGSGAWFEQHRRLEKLNLQAHQSAMANSDEFVLEAILTFAKLEVLIHDLMVIEAWKEFVYPRLLDRVAGRNSMRVYFILYHEATLVNLMEVLLYHKHVCEAGGEKMLELVDYVARKVTRLQSGYDFRAHTPSTSSSSSASSSAAGDGGATSAATKEYFAALSSRTPKDELATYLTEIEFKVCISACSMARFLCEHADAMPLSVVSRITDTHDMLVLLVPLIENPPWTRRNDNGKWQKLVDHKWTDVLPIDLLRITKLEGQPWLALYHLLAKEVFRERYHLNSFRKAQMLRVRKYLNDVLLDQLPILADIMRYMDELAVTEVPEPFAAGQNVFMFQQVSVARESIVKGKDWDAIATLQMDSVFVMTDKNDKDLRAMAELYADDLAEDVLDPMAP